MSYNINRNSILNLISNIIENNDKLIVSDDINTVLYLLKTDVAQRKIKHPHLYTLLKYRNMQLPCPVKLCRVSTYCSCDRYLSSLLTSFHRAVNIVWKKEIEIVHFLWHSTFICKYMNICIVTMIYNDCDTLNRKKCALC